MKISSQKANATSSMKVSAFSVQVNSLLFTALVLFCASFFTSLTFAGLDQAEGQSKPIRTALHNKLEGIQKEIDAADYGAALQALERLQPVFQNPPLNQLELAQIANLSGYVSFLLKNNDEAIAYHKQVASLDHGSWELQTETLKTISQLYYVSDNFEQSLVYIDRAIAVVEQDKIVPKESWLVLQKVANSETGNSQGAEAALKKLNLFYPDGDYDIE